MKPIVSNVVSTLASMGVSTVVVNVVKNNTPKDLSLYSKLMVGLGTFVLSGVLADICAEKLVEMIDDAIPVKRPSVMEGPVPLNNPVGNMTADWPDIQRGAELIQKYVDKFMTLDNPNLPGRSVMSELIRNFCLDNNLDVNNYEFISMLGDESNRLIKVQVVNAS